MWFIAESATGRAIAHTDDLAEALGWVARIWSDHGVRVYVYR